MLAWRGKSVNIIYKYVRKGLYHIALHMYNVYHTLLRNTVNTQTIPPTKSLPIYLFTVIQSYLTLIPLAPVISIYDAQCTPWCTLGGAKRCYILIEINVKRQSNPPGPTKYAAFKGAQRKFRAQQNYFKI